MVVSCAFIVVVSCAFIVVVSGAFIVVVSGAFVVLDGGAVTSAFAFDSHCSKSLLKFDFWADKTMVVMMNANRARERKVTNLLLRIHAATTFYTNKHMKTCIDPFQIHVCKLNNYLWLKVKHRLNPADKIILVQVFTYSDCHSSPKRWMEIDWCYVKIIEFMTTMHLPSSEKYNERKKLMNRFFCCFLVCRSQRNSCV